eukprot:2465673-Prymnesium_polylepis.3
MTVSNLQSHRSRERRNSTSTKECLAVPAPPHTTTTTTHTHTHASGLAASLGGPRSDVFTYALITDAETQP